jgi:hypothetical protein
MIVAAVFYILFALWLAYAAITCSHDSESGEFHKREMEGK